MSDIIPHERLTAARARRRQLDAARQAESVVRSARAMQTEMEVSLAILERLSALWAGAARRHQTMERLCDRCREIADMADIEAMIRERDALVQEHWNFLKGSRGP